MDHEAAAAFAAKWATAWNSGRLDQILALFSDDAEFASPAAVRLGAAPDGIVRGKDALARYWSAALAARPALRFAVDGISASAGAVVVSYSDEAGHAATEVLELRDGLVVRGLAAYAPRGGLEREEPRMPYCGSGLDRAQAVRQDPAALTAALQAPGSRALAFHDGDVLASGDPAAPVMLSGVDAVRLARPVTPVFLGLRDGAALFAADVGSAPRAVVIAETGADRAVPPRLLADGLTPEGAADVVYGHGMLAWHRRSRRCSHCGAPLSAADGGHRLVCTARACGTEAFPRIDPAVIVLAEAAAPRRCLLVRRVGAPADAWAAVAGFVEIGESAEDAVRRELLEEAGVAVRDVVYRGSQPWPFPSGLMLAYTATAEDTHVAPDGAEIEQARWFGEDELRGLVAEQPRLAGGDSVEAVLVRQWLARAHV